jgi:hemolysin activation/secretion protein
LRELSSAGPRCATRPASARGLRRATGLVLPAALCIAASLSVPVAADEATAGPQFHLAELVVEGNTVLMDEELRGVLSRHLGPQRTPADVERARQALQDAYHQRGFQSVSVAIAAESRRTVLDGTVILAVTEGRLRSVTVSGTEYSSPLRLRQQMPALVEGAVPNFRDVQAQLAQLQGRDRQVAPNVNLHEPTGGLDIDLAVSETRPLHGLVELNNRYSNNTTELRSMVMLSWDNAAQRGDSLSLMWQTSPLEPAEGTVLFGSYQTRLPQPGTSLQFTALDTQSDVAAVGGVNVVGSGRTAGVKWSLARGAGDGGQWRFSAGAEFKEFNNRILAGGAATDSPLTYAPLTLALSRADENENVTREWSATALFALPGIGSDSFEIGEQNRFGASRQMHWLRLAGSVAQTLDSGAQWRVAASAQATDKSLVSNEQMSAGGMDSVRGYLEAEASGDIGAIVGIEWHSPVLMRAAQDAPEQPWFSAAHAYAFLDLAALELVGHVTAGQADRSELASLGVGLRSDIGRHGHAVLELANPLADGSSTEKNDPRLLFRLWATF